MIEGTAIVFCEGAFDSTYGKTAHGLVRFTERYHVAAVIDSALAGQDAGEMLDGKFLGIPLVANLEEALLVTRKSGKQPTHFVVGIATDGGFLDESVKRAALEALDSGLNVDSGLHEFLSDLPDMARLAERKGLRIRDIRRTPQAEMHAFTGKIEEVTATRIAVLGTDSAVGKRTTAWMLVHALRASGTTAELIGTGQTAWMQGVRYGIIMDSLLNDYVSGELEHALWSAWKETALDVAVIEGQGSLMNPGYPGGFEILAAGRPHGIIMQHAPSRKEYDGFAGYPMDSLDDQIHAVEFLSKKKVIAITINHEGILPEDIEGVCARIEDSIHLPVVDPLTQGVGRLLPSIAKLRKTTRR